MASRHHHGCWTSLLHTDTMNACLCKLLLHAKQDILEPTIYCCLQMGSAFKDMTVHTNTFSGINPKTLGVNVSVPHVEHNARKPLLQLHALHHQIGVSSKPLGAKLVHGGEPDTTHGVVRVAHGKLVPLH